MKKKAVIWGLGGTAKSFIEKKGLYREFVIIAFTDNDPGTWNTEFMGIQVVEPSKLRDILYDYILICSLYCQEIREQIEKQLCVHGSKIMTCFEIEEALKGKLIQRYSSDRDEEIEGIVHYLENNPLNVYGSFVGTDRKYLVYRDQNNHPYIMLEGKRMYFPDTYSFIEAEGRQFVGNILYEQEAGSPHQYIREGDGMKDGSVIVDAGVCEGNFALRYIDKAQKVYLVEADFMWMQALERTFQPYRDKVVFCPKFLTRYDSASTITVDSLVKEKIDFLKMDIEGAEIDALMGAKNTLRQSNAKCAICSYHKQNDEENIRFLLEAYGYNTFTSQGYMFFLYDENIADTLDLRKGIVYGEKKVSTAGKTHR